MAVFDARGRQVVDLVDRYMDAGSHQIVWTGRNTGGKRVAPGVYFVRLGVGGSRVTSKVVLRR
jgi:hypothetical protein